MCCMRVVRRCYHHLDVDCVQSVVLHSVSDYCRLRYNDGCLLYAGTSFIIAACILLMHTKEEERED
jgi:hypothetical protein